MSIDITGEINFNREKNKIKRDYELTNVELNFNGGFLAGYITGEIKPKDKKYAYEFLFRIKDDVNGKENTIVSVDFGWESTIIKEQWNNIKEELTKVGVIYHHEEEYNQILFNYLIDFRNYIQDNKHTFDENLTFSVLLDNYMKTVRIEEIGKNSFFKDSSFDLKAHIWTAINRNIFEKAIELNFFETNLCFTQEVIDKFDKEFVDKVIYGIDKENEKSDTNLLDEETAYITFVLGYDLLQDFFANSEEPECDLVFEKCQKIVEEFKKTEHYSNDRKSLYDCLRDFIEEKLESIKGEEEESI